jgi:WD40 repeat protein
MSVCFSPDGQKVVTASYDRTARLWDVKTGYHVATFEGHGAAVVSAVFSPDGERVATASDDNTVGIWSTQAILRAS